MHNFSCIIVYKRPDGSQLEPKHVAANKSIKTGVVRDRLNSRTYTVELGYNDLGLCDTLARTSYIPWYQLTPHKTRFSLPCLVRHI